MERAGKKRLQHQGLHLRPAKSIALFQLHGDGLLSGRRQIIHESELAKIRASMEQHLEDPRIERWRSDYLHFSGNAKHHRLVTALVSQRGAHPAQHDSAWDRKGLFFVVLDTALRGHYPRAAHTGATFIITAGAQRGADEPEW